MRLTFDMQNTTEIRLMKAQRIVKELMLLTSSTLYNLGIDGDKLDKLDDEFEYLLELPFTEEKYKLAKKILSVPVREQIVREGRTYDV